MADAMTTPMKIKAIAPWFGAKRTLAADIVAELGRHTQYFEPFCGAMAVLFAKPPARQETVNDLHGDLTNLARVISWESWAVKLHDRLQQTLVCEGLLDDAQAALSFDIESGLRWERAYWYFLASWMGRNGVAGTDTNDYQLAVRWTAGGGSSTTRFRSAVESIPAWHERLRNVVILQRDAFDIIPRFQDAATTAIYVDPPYVSSSRSGLQRTGNHTSRYLHDFNDDAPGLLGGENDHTRLRDMLNEFRHARIVVSYYDCDRVRELYDGWRFVECGRQKNLARQNKGKTKTDEAPEVLIVNDGRAA